MQLSEERDLAMTAIRRIVGNMAIKPQHVSVDWLEATISRLDREQSLKAGRLAPARAASLLNEHSRQMNALREKAEIVIRCNAIYHPQPSKASLDMKGMLALEKAEREIDELVNRLEGVRDSYGMAIKSRVQREIDFKTCFN